MINLQNVVQDFLPFHDGLEAWGILILRIIWGIVLIAYGLPMLKHPFSWMDFAKPSGFPGFLQATGAITIFTGGMAMILGFLTPLAAFGLAGAMGIALWMHLVDGVPLIKHPPDAPGTSYEASLVYMAIAILFLFIGPGVLSLDYYLSQFFL